MRLALALLMITLPLTACGGSLNAVAKAATKATKSGSEHVQFSGTVVAAGQSVTLNGSGDFQTSPKLGGAHLAMSVAGKQITMDEVIAGSHLYMKSSIFSGNLPSGKTWVTVDLAQAAKKVGINFNQLSRQDPTDALTALKKAGSVKKVGPQVVDGVDTTHYRATVDLPKGIKSVPVDVWIDGQDELRRLTMHYTETVSGSTVASNLQMELSNYGEQVNVQVPKASDTVDMTSLGG